MMNRVLFVILCVAGPASLAYTPRQHIPIEERHNHKTEKFLVGEEITIQLECRPGTGYRWHETVSDTGVLVELEPPKFTPIPGKENQGEPGGTELQVFRYVAKKPGTAKFSAIHTRGPGTKWTDTFEVTIEVKELR